MKILIAPNSFKGSLWAAEVAEAIQEGLEQSGFTGDCLLHPVGDGGDGSGRIMRTYLGAALQYHEVTGPNGAPVQAALGWVEATATAIIELADCSGLRLLSPEDYQPLRANTFGLGQLIRRALDQKARQLLLGIGGSATIDGGTGLLAALGIKFIDQSGRELTVLPLDLPALAHIEEAGLDPRLRDLSITVLCDVKNPLLGPGSAITLFGPQKGADAEDLQLLTAGLSRFREITRDLKGVDLNALPFSGAAGGVAAALGAYADASAVDGTDYLLQLSGLEKKLKEADLVLTGEGRIDEQTLEGKAPFGVAKLAKSQQIPVIGLAGVVSATADSLLHRYFDRLISINPPGTPLATAMRDTRINLINAGREIGRLLQSGDWPSESGRS